MNNGIWRLLIGFRKLISFIRFSYLNYLLILFLLCLTYNSCKNSDPEKKDNFPEDKNKLNNPDSELATLFYPIVIPPSDIIIELNSLDIRLNPKLTNPLQNIEKYVKFQDKSLALGCYTVDFAYLANLQEKLLVAEYLDAIKEISNDLRLSHNITKDTWNRIELNRYNPDSLILISNDLYNSVVQSLKSGYRNDLLSMLLVGSFIETLYLTTQNLKNYSNIDEIIRIINDQKVIYDEYMKMINSLLHNPYVQKTFNEIKPLTKFFDSLEIKSDSTKTIMDSTGHLLVIGGDEIIFTYEKLNELQNVVNSVRIKLFLTE